jgi:prepilin-type N-terminal cleavage/methylation domain-containing protein
MAKARAFTLIELLVVIAIIALLISLLVPSLARAKYLAKVATCGVQMRELANSVHIYALNWNGAYPTGPMRGTGGNLWDIPDTVYDSLSREGVPHAAFFCPAMPDDKRDTYWCKWRTPHLPTEKPANYNPYSSFTVLGYFWWVQRFNGQQKPPPAPSVLCPPDPPGVGKYVVYDNTAVIRGPADEYDKLALKNPVITDCVFSRGQDPYQVPAGNADISKTQDAINYGLSLSESAHIWRGTLGHDNEGFGDGHVETIPGSKLKPRFYCTDNNLKWNWR